MVRRLNRKLRRLTVRALNLPEDFVFDVPRMTMIGNRQIYIENHRGVIGFSERLLQLRLSAGQVDIAGDGLVIRAIWPEEVFIEGTIQSILYKQP